VGGEGSAGLAHWLGGDLDFAPLLGMTVRRVDLDAVRKRKPALQTAEFTWMVGAFAAMKLDQEPFKDVRVRRALSLATSLKDILDASPLAQGQGVPTPAVPPALVDWAIPIDQLSAEGQRLYRHDPAAADRLLAAARHGASLHVSLGTAHIR